MDVTELSASHRVPRDGATPEAPVKPVMLRLVGGFRVDGAGNQLTLAGQRVLAFLALRGPTPRLAVATSLWPDASDDKASGSLRSALWRLRRSGVFVEQRPGRLLTLPGGLRVDVDTMVDLSRHLDGGEPTDDGVLVTPIPRGDLLAGWGDEWIDSERERFHHLRLVTLERLAVRLQEEERWSEAMDAARRAVELDPLRESAVRVLVTIHRRKGSPEQARSTFDRYRDILRRALGVEPSAELRLAAGLGPPSP